MYIPNPIRCRVCLKFGHISEKCVKKPICAFCSKEKHEGLPCQTIVPTCVNCQQHHNSLDLKCPRLKEEKEIKTIQYKEKVPYNVAKKIYRESAPSTSNKTYSDVTRNRKVVGVSVACQTEDFINTQTVSTETNNPSAPKSGQVTGLSSIVVAAKPPSPLPNPQPPLFSLPASLSPLSPSPLALPAPAPASLSSSNPICTDPGPPLDEDPPGTFEVPTSPDGYTAVKTRRRQRKQKVENNTRDEKMDT